MVHDDDNNDDNDKMDHEIGCSSGWGALGWDGVRLNKWDVTDGDRMGWERIRWWRKE